MKYMFLLYGDEALGETPSMLTEERSAEWTAFHQIAVDSGKLVGRFPLVPSTEAKTVRPKGNSLIETDGPYTETKEQFGGAYILECADMQEALSFAKKMPCAFHGTVEVRQILGE